MDAPRVRECETVEEFMQSGAAKAAALISHLRLLPELPHIRTSRYGPMRRLLCSENYQPFEALLARQRLTHAWEMSQVLGLYVRSLNSDFALANSIKLRAGRISAEQASADRKAVLYHTARLMASAVLLAVQQFRLANKIGMPSMQHIIRLIEDANVLLFPDPRTSGSPA